MVVRGFLSPVRPGCPTAGTTGRTGRNRETRHELLRGGPTGPGELPYHKAAQEQLKAGEERD